MPNVDRRSGETNEPDESFAEPAECIGLPSSERGRRKCDVTTKARMQRSERHAGIRAFQEASLFRPGGSRVVRSILLQPNRILRIAAVVIALLYFFFFGPGLVRFFQDRLEVPGFVF